jgi:endonuclease YncB( thermonuclease family)
MRGAWLSLPAETSADKILRPSILLPLLAALMLFARPLVFAAPSAAPAKASGKAAAAGKPAKPPAARQARKASTAKPPTKAARPSRQVGRVAPTKSPASGKRKAAAGPPRAPVSATPVTPTPAARAKPPPSRYYAVDGESFYLNGERVRIADLPERGADTGSEHAKQRLQMLLDSAEVRVEPAAADGQGRPRVRVQVNGRDVAELLAEPPKN